MPAFSIKIDGQDAVERRLENASGKYRRALAAAVYENAQQTMKQSVEITPKDTGFLRRSAFVTVPQPNKKNFQSVLGYGAAYASQVHEAVGRRFRVGQAKFLQTALSRSMRNFITEIARLTKRNFKRGSGVNSVAREFSTRPVRGKGKKRPR